MKFRTEINLTDAPKILSPERSLLLIGSCFSDNIGRKLRESLWPATVNPCGVIYSPFSIATLLELALKAPQEREGIIEHSITTREGKYVSWLMGSRSMGQTPQECFREVKAAIATLHAGLLAADALIVTFGTSDVWMLDGTDLVVGNCHKHPASEFSRRRLSIDEIVERWRNLIDELRRLRSDLKVIFTVSPRRYLSEGFADNSRLKAILLLACEELCSLHNVFYFPAFEILNDDLRDYRFYAPDLLHPSEQAVDYVWERFCEAYLDSRSMEKLRENIRAARRSSHRNIM